jgi:hypothetical protein
MFDSGYEIGKKTVSPQFIDKTKIGGYILNIYIYNVEAQNKVQLVSFIKKKGRVWQQEG